MRKYKALLSHQICNYVYILADVTLMNIIIDTLYSVSPIRRKKEADRVNLYSRYFGPTEIQTRQVTVSFRIFQAEKTMIRRS